MNLLSHLREDPQIILIRDRVNEVIVKSVLETFISRERLENTTEDAFKELHSDVVQLLTINYDKHKQLFTAQAPTDHLAATKTMFEKLTKAMIPKLVGLTKDNFANMAYNDSDDANKIGIKKVIVEHSNPFLFLITEMVRSTVYELSGLQPKANLEAFSSFMFDQDKVNSDTRSTTKTEVTNLQAQMASLTSAVAENVQSENDKKLRLRNLGKVITTQPIKGGNYEASRANKETREKELKTWLTDICKEGSGYNPGFSLFLIDPKSASKQGTTAILTVPLESDKFRIEQIISSKRKADRDLPSSQRFTGKDHPAFNIPNFNEMSNRILLMYENELKDQLTKITDPGEKDAIEKKWTIHIPDISLYITRKTTKKTFSIYFEFRDPTNNLTLMRYMSNCNPFERFNFREEIPNPGTIQKAISDAVYKKRYLAYKK
jgi:hypothetical protein